MLPCSKCKALYACMTFQQLANGEKNWQCAPGGTQKALKPPPRQLEHFSGVSLRA